MRTQDRGRRSAVRAHHVVGVVHVVEYDGDRRDVCDVIKHEIEGCTPRALVIDLTEPLTEEDTARILAALEHSPRGVWHVCEPGDEDGRIRRRMWHDDGRELVIRHDA